YSSCTSTVGVNVASLPYKRELARRSSSGYSASNTAPRCPGGTVAGPRQQCGYVGIGHGCPPWAFAATVAIPLAMGNLAEVADPRLAGSTLQLKLSHCTKNRVINATHERSPRQLLLLVLLSEAAGGGRTALILKKLSDAFPKAASEPGGFFHAASAGANHSRSDWSPRNAPAHR